MEKPCPAFTPEAVEPEGIRDGKEQGRVSGVIGGVSRVGEGPQPEHPCRQHGDVHGPGVPDQPGDVEKVHAQQGRRAQTQRN